MDKSQLQPFIWVQHEKSVSVILNVGMYKQEIFDKRQDEGFEGNGYDWASLAAVYLEEKMPELASKVSFDPEGDMFCAYSSDADSLWTFMSGFKAACEDDALISDLLSRAELD